MAANGILASMSVVLSGEISGFQRAMAQARRELSGFVKAGELLKGVGESLTTYLSAPLALVGAASLKVGGDFESGMNRVQAATLATGKELTDLRAKAKDIALDPRLKFSAEDAAGALEALAKNGVSTTDILGGAADAAVNLSTATGGELAQSADIATDVMQNFGKTAGQLAGVVDLVTGSTIASKFGIEDYAGALAQAGAVSGQLGVSFEDFNTAISATSSGFSSGSDAGTSFKTFLQRLNPASKEAAAAMQKLGLKFFDAQGQMKPLRIIAGDLQRAFKDLSDEQRNSLGTQIFGADSIRTALLLAKQGTEGFDQMAQSIGKVKAASQGAILSQGFNGALEAFKSSLEGLGIAIAESGVLEFGTQLLKAGADIVSGLAQTDPAILKTVAILGGIAVAVGPVLAAVGALGAALPAITVGLGLLTGPVGIAVAGFTALAVGAAAVAGSATDSVAAFRSQQQAVQGLEKDVVPLLNRYDELKGKTKLTKAEQEELRAIVQRVGEQIPTAISAFDAYGKAIDISTESGRRFVEQQRAILLIKNKDALREQRQAYKDLSGQIEGAQNALKKFDDQGRLVKASFDEGGGGFVPLTADEITKLQARLQDLQLQRKGVGGLIDELKGIQPAVQQATAAAADLNTELSKPAAGGLTDDQTKALEKLREELQQNQLRYQALGEQYDVVGNKQRILQSGIESLIAVGFRPMGKVVQGFAGQLLQIPAAVDAIDTPLTEFLEKINKAAEKQEQKEFKPFGDIVLPELPNALPSLDIAPFTGPLQEASRQMALFQLTAEMFSEGLRNVLQYGLADIAVSIGESIGQMVAGVGGTEILFSSVLSAVGSMAVQLGQLAIGTGIAVSGIKASLESLNPAFAIAGGIALVALGAAVKGVASNIAKRGAAGSATPVGGTAPTPQPRAYEAQKMKIEVVFKEAVLRQDGPSLRGVLSVDSYRQVFD